MSLIRGAGGPARPVASHAQIIGEQSAESIACVFNNPARVHDTIGRFHAGFSRTVFLFATGLQPVVDALSNSLQPGFQNSMPTRSYQ